jgi:Chaperone of endosialidase
MTTLKHLAFGLAVTLFVLAVSAQAQTPRMTTVNISAQSDKVHISAEGDVSELRVDVADESGDVIFQSGAITGQQLDWNMKDTSGERVAAGTYLVTVTFRDAAGKLKKRVEQVTVEEAEQSGTQAATAPQAVQETVTTSNPGVFGTIARFTGESTIANSVISQSIAGKIGIGTTAPAEKLHLLGPESRLRLQSMNSDLWTVTEYVTDNRAWHTGVGGSNVPNDVKGKYYIYDATAQQFRMAVDTNGNVGIGTSSPKHKLEVRGATSLVFDSVVSVTNSGKGMGLHGSSINNAGVHGFSENYWGVRGDSTSGTGVYGNSYDGIGVQGFSANDYAGYFDGKVHVTGTFTHGSDRNLKANFSTVNPRSVLDKLATVPIQTWNYKSEPQTVRHIGVTAQDFRAAFNLGEGDKTIATVDADGVALAAIQGLYQMMQERDRQIEHLRSQVAQLQRTVKQQRKRSAVRR